MSPGGLGGGQTSTGGPLTDFRRGRRSLPLPSERVKSRAATEERGVRWSWLPGGPLTDFGRRRPNLPLPSERVKIRNRHVRPCCLRGRALTYFRRRRRNPSASSGQVLPLPQARGGLAGMWFDKLTTNGVGRLGAVGVGGLPGVAWVRFGGWMPLGPGWGRRDAGGTEGAGRRLGAAWDVFRRSFSFGADVSSFWADVFTFEGNVSTLAGDVSSFWRGALVGAGARTEGEIPRLRCAALGMTAAAGEVRAGCGRGRGGRLRWD